MTLEQITFGQLMGAVVVVLALLGAYKTVMEVVRIRREEKARQNAPVDDLKARVEAHEQMLTKDKKRIEDLDGRINAISDQSTMLLRGVRALLSHEINGNSVDKLNASATEIDDYLISRK